MTTALVFPAGIALAGLAGASSAAELKVVENGKSIWANAEAPDPQLWQNAGEILDYRGGYPHRYHHIRAAMAAVGDCECRIKLKLAGGGRQNGPWFGISHRGYLDLFLYADQPLVRIHSRKMVEGFEEKTYPRPRDGRDGKPHTLAIRRVGDDVSFHIDDARIDTRTVPAEDPLQFTFIPRTSHPRIYSMTVTAERFVEPPGPVGYQVRFPSNTPYRSSGKASQESAMAFRYRIPALVVSQKETVLAFAEARRDSGRDDCDIDIVVRRSSDNGKTWGPEIKVLDQGRCTSGNPCPVVLGNGRILLLTCRNPHGAGEGGRTVFVTHSDDDGLTWSEPREITGQAKKPGWHWYATGPGAGIQLTRGEHKGRIIIPCNHSVENNYHSHIIHSDDNGENWTIGAVSPVGLNECQAVELADGDVMVNSRNHRHSSKFRGVCVSHDGGGSFDPDLFRRDEQLPEPWCQATIRRLSWPSDGKPGIILFCNPGNTKGRHHLMLRASYDDGKTWPWSAMIYKGPAAYSDLAILPDGRIGLLFEKDGYATVEFAVIPPPPAVP